MMANERYGPLHDKPSDSPKSRSSGHLPLEMRFHLESAPIVQCRHHESMCGLAYPQNKHKGRMSWVSSYQQMLMPGALYLGKVPQPALNQNGLSESSDRMSSLIPVLCGISHEDQENWCNFGPISCWWAT